MSENINELKESTGYSTTTYRLLLEQQNLSCFEKTRELYNLVILHFYQMLHENPDLLCQTNMQLMRNLEVLSIGTKEQKATGQKVKYPLENISPKIPLYFRRAAINAAISLARTEYQRKTSQVSPSSFRAAPVYYKGMYRKFSENSIELKLFNGSKWNWGVYKFRGRKIPGNAEKLSPTLKIDNKNVWLHVPVMTKVADIRKVKTRMEEHENFCTAVFPFGEIFAAAAVYDYSGNELSVRFFHGVAKQKEERRRQLSRLSLDSAGEVQNSQKNDLIYRKIHQINEHYAHSVSRQIINFCEGNKVKVLVVPNYDKDYRRKKGHYKEIKMEWIGRKIIRFLDYKAFQNGIILTKAFPGRLSSVCSLCGAKIRTTPKEIFTGKELYQCPNGHRGNQYLNETRNLANNFLEYYKQKPDILLHSQIGI